MFKNNKKQSEGTVAQHSHEDILQAMLETSASA